MILLLKRCTYYILEVDSGESEEENEDDTTTTSQAIRKKDNGNHKTHDSDKILIGM